MILLNLIVNSYDLLSFLIYSNEIIIVKVFRRINKNVLIFIVFIDFNIYYS